MNKTTYYGMLHELCSHNYGIGGEYSIGKLFKVFSEYEITKFEDIFKESLAKDFREFVLSHINLLRGLERDENGKITNDELVMLKATIHKKVATFGLYTSDLFKDYRCEQEEFVKIVEHIIGKCRPNVLEIGSGQVPYTSILLAHDNIADINSMDKFLLSDKALKNLQVNPIDKYFKEDTNVEDYDFVIGNRPCSAIAHIVSSCKKYKKPYFIKLCGCEAPNGKTASWDEYLQKIDKNIDFLPDPNSADNHYAFNLDM